MLEIDVEFISFCILRSRPHSDAAKTCPIDAFLTVFLFVLVMALRAEKMKLVTFFLLDRC